MKLSLPEKWKAPHYLLAIAVLSSSFDIVACIDVCGYTVRLSQIALVPIVIYALYSLLSRKAVWPKGFAWLLAWGAVQLVFTFRSPSLINAVGYEAWLIFDILTILGFARFIDSQKVYGDFIALYLDSFALMSIVGLLQLLLYPFGVNFFVTQYWTDSLARINGFCYEPSFYATYMLIGFVAHAYLIEKRSFHYLARKKLIRNFALIVIAIVLSSSRMGWLMLAVWVLFRIVLAFARGEAGGIAISRLKLGSATALVLLVGVVLIAASGIDLRVPLNGLGLFGGSNHSSEQRFEGLAQCIEVFSGSPLLGYSLGGVDPVLAVQSGGEYVNGDNGAAMSVVGELLVANGILGFIPFVGYFAVLFSGFRKATDKLPSHVVHRAFLWALVFELLILCFNQNILRPYLWIHLAMVSVSWNYAALSMAGSGGHNASLEPEERQDRGVDDANRG